jgi:hypothetical protein
MTLRSVSLLGILWVASLVGAVALAQTGKASGKPANIVVLPGSSIQTPPTIQTPPPGQTPPIPRPSPGPPGILTGADIGFRVEGPGPAGTLMIKLNGRWVEAEFAPKPRVKLVR